MSRSMNWRAAVIAAGTMALTAGTAGAQDKELVFGLQCDRTGATQTVGVFLCPGYHDYINLVNSKGGVEGYKIKVIEIDNEYKVPPAMEAHERFKKEGAVLEGIYGTPQTAALTKKLEPLIAPPGFTGNAPGGPSRWSTKRSNEWQPLKPKLVVEVCYDHFAGERFRHGTKLMRWRPDKSPKQCTIEQVKQKKADLLKLLK